MPVLSNTVIISGLLAIIVGLLAYSVLVPRNLGTFSPDLSKNEDNKMLKIGAALGAELYASLPRGMAAKERPNAKIESLLVRSGNPWNLTAPEFIFFQWVTAFAGFIAGWIVWAALGLQINIPWLLPVGLFTVFGYFIPKLKYRDQAKKRDLDFKRQLPEALDLIIISLSGGETFVQALRDSLPNMQDGVLKNEFREIVKSVDTGKTLNESLEAFGKKAPNESIRTFVQAVREATELDVPLVDVLKARAEASRQEFFALIHNKTAQLSSKMMAILTPTLIPALLIIVLTPALASLLLTLGSH